MRKNFLVVDNYGLECNSKTLDLHNDFDIEKIIFDPFKRTLTLRWLRSDKQDSHPENTQHFHLQFKKVSVLKISGDLSGDIGINDLTLSYMGYLHPDDIEQMDGSLLENEANEGYHLVFAFESKLFLKVFAESAEVVE